MKNGLPSDPEPECETPNRRPPQPCSRHRDYHQRETGGTDDRMTDVAGEQVEMEEE
jgi:hypothetical protein